MTKTRIQRIQRPLRAAEKKRLETYRKKIAKELPDLIERDHLRSEAMAEKTLSGKIRCAIHQCGQTLDRLAESIGVTGEILDDFLTGEQTLQSDVMDRLVSALGLQIIKKSHRNLARSRENRP